MAFAVSDIQLQYTVLSSKLHGCNHNCLLHFSAGIKCVASCVMYTHKQVNL